MRFGRVWQVLITLVGVSLLTFGLMYMAPGDPVQSILRPAESGVSKAVVAEMRAAWGLDQPWYVQYGRWLLALLQGNLGTSYLSHRLVSEEILQAMPATLWIAGGSLCLTVVASLGIGIYCAEHQDQWQDRLGRTLSFIGLSMPSFVVGLLLLYVLGVKWHWIPIAPLGLSWRGALGPILTLSIVMTSMYMRQVRLVFIEEREKPYVLGAETRGIPTRLILWRHILPNALMPLFTQFGLAFGWLLGGVVIVEVVFSWPGLGSLLIQSIYARDYPVVQALVLWSALAYMAILMVVEMTYTYWNPMLRQEENRHA